MARTTAYQLPVGQLIGRSFGIYLRNFVPFTVLGACVLAPWIAFRLFVQEPITAERSPYEFLGVMLERLLSYVLTGAVTYGVVMQLRGEPANLAQALAKGLRTFFRVFGTAFLCGLRIFLFTLLLFIPGVIQQVRLYVAIPASVMENKGGGDAMARSESLTRGSGWAIFGSWLIAFLLEMGLGFGLGFLIGSRTIPVSASRWFEIGIALVTSSFGATLMAVCYFMLRQGKENVDAKQIAAVFD